MAITITKQPVSGTYYEGQPLIVEASGDNLSYQWQREISGTWTNIASAVSPMYEPPATASYRVVIYSVSVTRLATETLDVIVTEDGMAILTDGSATESATSNTANVTFIPVPKSEGSDIVAYVKDGNTWALKDVLQCESYSITEDIDFAGKSFIKTVVKPNIKNDDFVLLKQGNRELFVGLCDDYSSDESSGYTINLCQPEGMLDREIFVSSESTIFSTGIEDFIVSEITANWINSGDVLLDRSYITALATTHTPINADAGTSNGVYNLKEFLANAKKYHGIVIAWTVTDIGLTITVRKDSNAALPIDVTITDVADYSETYNIDVLAKLIVKWKNTETEAVATRTYYLKTDMSITTNASDPDRATGIIKAKYVEKASQAEVDQEAVNEFTSNKYEHKISFNLLGSSKAYPVGLYYVGRKASIKTKTGIQTSIITGLSRSSDSAFYSFTFGTLKVTLIEKLRGDKS